MTFPSSLGALYDFSCGLCVLILEGYMRVELIIKQLA